MSIATQASAAARGQLRASDLEEFDLLRHLPRDQVDDLIRRSQVTTLLAGEPLITAGQVNHRMYLLLSGRLHVHLRTVDSEPIATLLPGEAVGELSILDQKSTSAHVIAADPCRVLVVGEDCFWNLLGSSHAFALNLLLKLAERLRSNNEAVSESTQLRERFERAALFDSLTNVNNRRWLESTLPRLVERHTMESRPLSLAVIDLDGFGQLNDRFGAGVGDRLLVAVAITLRSRLRPLDQISRHGGGSFSIVLPDTDLVGAKGTADRIREAIQATKPFGIPPANLPRITASVGLAQLQPPQSAGALLARAEAALHRAKQSGPNACMS